MTLAARHTDSPRPMLIGGELLSGNGAQPALVSNYAAVCETLGCEVTPSRGNYL